MKIEWKSQKKWSQLAMDIEGMNVPAEEKIALLIKAMRERDSQFESLKAIVKENLREIVGLIAGKNQLAAYCFAEGRSPSDISNSELMHLIRVFIISQKTEKANMRRLLREIGKERNALSQADAFSHLKG